METLKTLTTETYNYKGLEVKRIDTIEQAMSWSLGAYLKRTWFVNGHEAHTFRINGEVKLAFYEVEASKGGVRKILGSFQPNVSFYFENTTEAREMVYKLTGKFVESEVIEY